MSESTKTPAGRIRPATPTLMGVQVPGLAQQCRPPTDDTMLVPAPPAGLAESAKTPLISSASNASADTPFLEIDADLDGRLDFESESPPPRGIPSRILAALAVALLATGLAAMQGSTPSTPTQVHADLVKAEAKAQADLAKAEAKAQADLAKAEADLAKKAKKAKKTHRRRPRPL